MFVICAVEQYHVVEIHLRIGCFVSLHFITNHLTSPGSLVTVCVVIMFVIEFLAT